MYPNAIEPGQRWDTISQTKTKMLMNFFYITSASSSN